MIVLHKLEYSLNHRVLEIVGRIECGYFARKMLVDPEVFARQRTNWFGPIRPVITPPTACSRDDSVPSRCTSMLRERSKQRRIGAAICMHCSIETMNVATFFCFRLALRAQSGFRLVQIRFEDSLGLATTVYGTVTLSFVIASVPGFPTSRLSAETTYVVLPKENHKVDRSHNSRQEIRERRATV